MTRDYALTGPDAKRAVETGLAAAEWYHTDVPRALMKSLMQRSDGPAIRDTVIWLADDQQGAVGLNRAREMDLFPFAVRKVGFSECWCSERVQRQLSPLGFPRRLALCRPGRND